jgi:hypothetical protein
MSVSSIINNLTGKIYDNLIPQGGGIPLTKGQLISADINGVEVAVPVGANGTILMADSNQDDGLRWAVVPGAQALTQGELISANQAGDVTIVTAPNLPVQDKWVLTATGAGGAGGTNMVWSPATGAGGIIDTVAPLVDVAGQGTNTISIGFALNSVGQIPYGTGVLNTGALTNTPANNTQFLGIQGGVPTWKPLSDSVVGIAPIIEVVGAGDESQIGIAFGAVVGQIPYGIGTTNTGALTNTPTAGQILGISAGVPTWIPAGGSGTVTALAPLTEYAVGASSNIAIDFVAKGDLVVGGGPQAGGNPIAGVILPVGANDMVLTANSNTASGLEWVASGAGSSATIFRNSNDTTPLLIAKPATANDTCVITADRVFNSSSSQIYNVAGAGTQTPSASFLVYSWTPAINISISTIVANLKLEGNGSFGGGINTVVSLTTDNQGLNSIATSDTVSVEPAQSYNFISFDNLPVEVIGGTTYYFWVLFTLAQGDQTWSYINGTQVGDITVTGISYPAQGVSTFTCPVGTKFRGPNDLTGKTTATCSSFSSQSFVATADTNDWIMVGQLNGGVILSP